MTSSCASDFRCRNTWCDVTVMRWQFWSRFCVYYLFFFFFSNFIRIVCTYFNDICMTCNIVIVIINNHIFLNFDTVVITDSSQLIWCGWIYMPCNYWYQDRQVEVKQENGLVFHFLSRLVLLKLLLLWFWELYLTFCDNFCGILKPC